ncbi:uncharacterized protein LOC117610586 [Osmia lignaria lignaria]|uniref:uncharacterized protein LOC117610586 n=1 Tax=Osmia lignaria lignaria TaxID=1437193 RepID=UPI00402B73F9
MKPVSKTRDFSIESILADKRIPIQNDREEYQELLSVNDDYSVKNSRKYFEEECTIRNRRINHELIISEAENCDLNFQRKSEVIEEKYKINSEEVLNEYRNDSLDVESSEYNQNKNKLQTNSTDKCIIDSKSNLITEVEEGNRISDKTFISRDQNGKLNKERKKQLKQYQSDSHFKCSNKDSNDSLKKQYKNLKNNVETTQNKYSLFENEIKEENESSRGKLDVVRDVEKLEWLHCTRYKPPKIPRKPTIGKSKRKPSFYPRIPFSMFQLEYLEQKFQTSAYLMRHDVMEMSDVLKIPPNRIKIWFQNRRAKERREFCTNI